MKESRTQRDSSPEFYIVRRRAVPSVLQKVVLVNQMIASGRARTVNEAADAVGVSRSSYYKFKDDIEEFHDNVRGTTLNLICEINDETGLLSDLLGIIADYRANILTIHQSIPVSGVASLSISIQIREDTEDLNAMIADLRGLEGVRKVSVRGREQGSL